jgi:hypothetical protein
MIAGPEPRVGLLGGREGAVDERVPMLVLCCLVCESCCRARRAPPECAIRNEEDDTEN